MNNNLLTLATGMVTSGNGGITDYFSEKNKLKASVEMQKYESGISALSKTADTSIRAYVECQKLKSDRLNMQLQSENIRSEQKENTKRFGKQCKTEKKRIKAIKEIALKSNDPELIRAVAEAMKAGQGE